MGWEKGSWKDRIPGWILHFDLVAEKEAKKMAKIGWIKKKKKNSIWKPASFSSTFYQVFLSLSDSYPAFFLLIATTSNKNF
jgi:hypothetical protein